MNVKVGSTTPPGFNGLPSTTASRSLPANGPPCLPRSWDGDGMNSGASALRRGCAATVSSIFSRSSARLRAIAAAWAVFSAVGGWRSRFLMMERICAATSLAASWFADGGGVQGLEVSLAAKARWTWACWPEFNIFGVSIVGATKVPKKGSD